MLHDENKLGLYSVAAAVGGLVLALAAGMVLPTGMAVFLLLASQVAALALGTTSRGSVAGRIGMVMGAALVFFGLAAAVPLLVEGGGARGRPSASTPEVPAVESPKAPRGPAAKPAAPPKPSPPKTPPDTTPPRGSTPPEPAPPADPKPRPSEKPAPPNGADPTPGEPFPKVPFQDPSKKAAPRPPAEP